MMMEFIQIDLHTVLMEEFIGIALKQLRNNADLTQEEFAHRIQTSTGQVSKMECNDRSPSMRVLVRAAQEFGMPVSKIIELAEQLYRHRAMAIKDIPASYILANQRVMVPFMRLSADDQDLVETVIARLNQPIATAKP